MGVRGPQAPCCAGALLRHQPPAAGRPPAPPPALVVETYTPLRDLPTAYPCMDLGPA
eukprot:COSAG01_NODE_812_length_13409_cov_20.449812_1_plen_57_part_00